MSEILRGTVLEMLRDYHERGDLYLRLRGTLPPALREPRLIEGPLTLNEARGRIEIADSFGWEMPDRPRQPAILSGYDLVTGEGELILRSDDWRPSRTAGRGEKLDLKDVWVTVS